jgi:hypothetical protein
VKTVSSTHLWRILRFANRAVDLYVWKVAANVLNRQSWTADKAWSSSLEDGRRNCKIVPFVAKLVQRPRNWTDSLKRCNRHLHEVHHKEVGCDGERWMEVAQGPVQVMSAIRDVKTLGQFNFQCKSVKMVSNGQLQAF